MFLSKSVSIFLALASSCNAFSSIGPKNTVMTTVSTTTALNVGATFDWNNPEDEAFVMKKAQACIDSDTCSLDDAKTYLDDVIHIQSGCASGVLIGSDVCEDVDNAAEIVAGLREKIERETRRVGLLASGSALAGGYLGLILLSIFVAGMTAVNPDVAPFTPQEWYWAIRDGYLPTMVEHYFRHGGLATIDYDPETIPFTMQEWWWAAKGGYLNTMVDHFFQNGGLSTVAEYQPEAVPITPQEWIWAARDGYLGNLADENFKAGGFVTASLQQDTLPLTPQEWVWAVRDGYFPTLVHHFYENGGL